MRKTGTNTKGETETAALVVWPGILFPNSRGNKAAANLRLNDNNDNNDNDNSDGHDNDNNVRHGQYHYYNDNNDNSDHYNDTDDNICHGPLSL